MASAASTVHGEINEAFLLCGICLEMYKTPKCLPCLHSYCEPCLTTLVEKRGGKEVTCPTCRRSVQLPENGVTGIATDMILKALVERHSKREKGPGGAMKCEGCEEGDCIKHCADCGVGMCRNCAASHSKFLATRSHTLMTLEEFHITMKSDDPSTTRSPLYCVSHQGNEVEFFCDTCDKAACLKCIMLEHPRPDHTYGNITEPAAQFSKRSEEMLEIMESKESEARKSQTSIKEVIEALRRCYQTEEAKLKTHVDKMIEEDTRLIKEKGDKLLRELKEEYEVRKTNLDAQLKELEGAENDLSHTREYISNAIRYASASQLMIAKKGISAQVDVLLNVETESQPVADDFIRFLPSNDFCDTRSVGEILKHDGNYKLTNCPTLVRVGEDIKVTMVNEKPQASERPITVESVLKKPDQEMEAVRVTNNDNRTWTLTTSSNVSGEHELSVTVRHNHVMGSPMCFDVFPQKGLLWQVGKSGNQLGELYNPWGVRLTRTGYLQVCDCDNERLQKFTFEGEPNSTLKFSNIPSSVRPVYSVQADNGYIFTTDQGSNQVIVHDESGNVVRFFGKGTFACPFGIAISPVNGMVYAADHTGHCIHIYKQDGNLYQSFGTNGQGKGQLYYPLDIKINQDGKVYVSEYSNHRIQVFDSMGQSLYTFGSQGSGDGQMNNPTGLALDHVGNVYVCDRHNNRVLKFTSDGEFICRIDSADKPCNSPTGVYITDDEPLGKVVVVNSNCLQMFAQ